jgi:hypothetical protein
MLRPLSIESLIYMSNLNYIIMKNLKLFIAAFALVFAVQVSANTEKPIKATAQLQSELVHLMGSEVPFQIENGELTAEVLFTVNSKGEVIVLKIVSDNPAAEKYIKSRINYKKVSHRTSKPGEIYMMPVRVVQS